MTTQELNALAPCPFCGGPAEDDGLRPYRALGSSRLGHGYAVYCTECDADMMVCYEDHPGADREALAADLRDRWNIRTAATSQASVNAMREAYPRDDDALDAAKDDSAPAVEGV